MSAPPTMHWHENGCQCQGCQQARLQQHQSKKGPYGTLVGILLVLVLLGAAMSFYDPNLNFPVVSQVVCSMKGDTWYSGGLLGAPGCYAPTP
jgi:hypothetical protein